MSAALARRNGTPDAEKDKGTGTIGALLLITGVYGLLRHHLERILPQLSPLGAAE